MELSVCLLVPGNIGEKVKDDEPGIYLDAVNGDVVIRANKGKVRIEVPGYPPSCFKGPDGETGNVVIDDNEKFIVTHRSLISVVRHHLNSSLKKQ